MKVEPVSLNFKSKYNLDNYDSRYMYYRETPRTFDKNKIMKHYSFTTAFLAVSAVIIALLNLGKRPKFPKNIVEISELNKGLNKIKNQDKVINEIKTKFIYPIKAADSGDTKITESSHYNSGIIIAGKSEKELKQINDALKEHFEYLNIDTSTINSTISRKKDGQIITKNLKKNTIVKNVYKEIEKAKNKFKETGRYTIISLGKFDDITCVQITKSKKSKIDNLILNLSNKDNTGIIWTAWTTEAKSIPIYLNDLPVLITKLNN